MTTVTKEFQCSFQTSREVGSYRSAGQNATDGIYNPNTYAAFSPDVIGQSDGWVSCEDPTVIGTQASDGIAGHRKHLWIPKMPARATIISAQVQWQSVIPHIVSRTENVAASTPGDLTLNHGRSLASLCFQSFPANTDISMASGYHYQSNDPDAHSLVTLDQYDGATDWMGASGKTHVDRFTGLAGVAPHDNLLATTGFDLQGWKGTASSAHVVVIVAVSWPRPTRTWTGVVNSLYTRDTMWAQGDFKIQIVYDY